MLGSEKIYLEEVDSTNRYLMDLLDKEKVGEGTVVIAAHQTAGRGMDNNRWESEPGLNLTFSFVIYPGYLGADQQFYLNKALSLALTDVVRELVTDPSRVQIKWPNDIYFADNKLAGMLIQNGVKGHHFEYSVIGIGLNVNQSEFLSDAANPVSLKNITGRDYDLQSLLMKLLHAIDKRLGMLEKGDRSILDHDYLAQLYRQGVPGNYLFKGQEIVARINGVNRYGQLILEIPGEKIIECDLKEVKFLI